MQVRRLLIFLDFECTHCVRQEVRHAVLLVVTFHEDVDVAVWHDVQTLIRLSKDGHDRLLLHDVLKSHVVNDAESKLNTELEPLVGVAIANGLA